MSVSYIDGIFLVLEIRPDRKTGGQSIYMPRGIHLSQDYRELISQKFVCGYTAEQIFEDVFCSNNSIISLSYLLSLCKDLADPFFRSSFLGGPYLKSGRRVLIDENETEAIKLFVALDDTKVIHSMKLDFVQLYHGLLLPQQQQQQPYSKATFLRTLHRQKFSIKKIERRHMLCNYFHGLQYYDMISHLNVFDLVDIDEMSSSPETFYRKNGWSPIGDDCRRTQIVIGTRTYSTIAAVTPFGFLCWQIFEGTITHQHFMHFLNNS